MEVVGLLRGYWRDFLEWVNDASMIHLPYKYREKNKRTGKMETKTRFIRVAIRPIIPVEIVFPKESLKTLMGMIRPGGNRDYIRDKSKKNKSSFEMARKMMGLKKLPTDWPRYKHHITNILEQHAVAFHPLGLKEDGQLKIVDGEAL